MKPRLGALTAAMVDKVLPIEARYRRMRSDREIREHVAAHMALHRIIVSEKELDIKEIRENYVASAYATADAMLAARVKE